MKRKKLAESLCEEICTDFPEYYSTLRKDNPDYYAVVLSNNVNLLHDVLNSGNFARKEEQIDALLKSIASLSFGELCERKFEKQKKQINKFGLEKGETVYIHDMKPDKSYYGCNLSGIYQVIETTDKSMILTSNTRRVCLEINKIGKDWCFEKIRTCNSKPQTTKKVKIGKHRIYELVGKNIQIGFINGKNEGYSAEVLRIENRDGIEFLVVRKDQETKERKFSFCSFNKDWEAFEIVH